MALTQSYHLINGVLSFNSFFLPNVQVEQRGAWPSDLDLKKEVFIIQEVQTFYYLDYANHIKLP